MSLGNTGSRTEPIRTRTSSKKEKQKSGTSDIKEAFKMAAAKSDKNEPNNTKTKPNSQEQKTASLTNTKEVVEKEFRDCATQVSMELMVKEVGEEDVHQDQSKQDKGCTIDIEKQEMLEAIKELSEAYTRLDGVVNHPKEGIGAKLVNQILRADTTHSTLHGAANGVLTRLDNMQKEFSDLKSSLAHMEQNQTQFSRMMQENKRLASDLLTAQGLLQKYSQKIKTLESKVLDLTRRGMEQNLIIHGIEEREGEEMEDCYDSVAEFVEANFQFKIDEADVWKAFRMGIPRNNKARAMFVKLSYYARDRIMDNVRALKDKRNKHGQVLFVSEQIPEGITETRKTLSKRASALREQERKKPSEQQRKVKILGEHVVVGGQISKPEVNTPQPYELFPGVEEQKKINSINQKIKEAEPSYVMNSSFVGLAVNVRSVQDTYQAYRAVMQRFPYMDHVMMAYQFKEEDQIKSGSCDDTEFGGGAAIAKYLQENALRNIAVFVVRRYGGIHLGYDHFNIIQKAAQKAIKLLRPQEDGSNNLE